MQYYDISIAANGSQKVAAQGTFLYYLSGNAGGADTTLKVRAGFGGTTVLLKPGQSIQLPAGEVKGDTWILESYANAATILGVVLVGEGDFSDNRISGAVEVIDGGKNRTLAKSAFMAAPGQAATAGQISHVQLWNPAGTGKNLMLERVATSANVAAEVDIVISTGQLTSASNGPQSKYLGSGATSVAQSRAQTNATTLSGGLMASLLVQAATSQIYPLSEPIVIPPGQGVTILSPAPNTTVIGIFEWYEEAQ